MRMSFIASFRNMTLIYYVKQPKPMCETKLFEIIARNPKLINCLNRNNCHSLIRKKSDFPFNYDEYCFVVMNCFFSVFFIKMTIKTNLFENYVEFFDTTRKQNTYFEKIFFCFFFTFFFSYSNT